MKTLACVDVMEMDEECPFVVKGNTDQEVMDQMIDHIAADHPEMVGKMSDLEMKEKMAEMIQEEGPEEEEFDKP